METNIHFFIILARFLLELEMFQTKVFEKIKTHFIFNKFFFFFENRAIYKTTWKNIVERCKATDDNMAHAHCILDA